MPAPPHLQRPNPRERTSPPDRGDLLERPKRNPRDRSREVTEAHWAMHLEMRQRLLRDRRRRFRLTRDGKLFVLVTIIVGFAALNTANNLLYLLLGLLFSLLIINAIMGEMSLRQLTIVRRLPHRAQVGKAHLVEVEIFNHKTRAPSYAIEVEDLREGHPADKRCFFLKISPRSAQVAAYRRTPTHRGLDIHTGFRVATRFPFGIFERSREVQAMGELVLYPATDPMAAHALVQAEGREHVPGTRFPAGEEFVGVRPMRVGEDPRDIHWRKTASAGGQSILRERGRAPTGEVTLTLDRVPTGDAFERHVREVASRALAHVKRGDTVIVRASEKAPVSVNRTTGVDPLLRFLALITPVGVDAPLRKSLPSPEVEGTPEAEATENDEIEGGA